ncbi:MAG: 4Fe-4S cluster-binding domain-containing protein [Tepidanaerobacteraceae bacterium]|nr:4Fe-4S cluster-binding domain-containing protein [Tepidanaerobacteraceae bacterium]
MPRVKQAGRGGAGSVFRNKKIKALIVKFSGVKGDTNGPADKKKIIDAGLRLHREIKELDDLQNRMRKVGTSHLVEIINDYDLLPTMNYKYGSHPQACRLSSEVFKKYYTQNMPDGCWYGCSMACAKAVDNFELKTGPYKGKKVCVDGPEYETIAGLGSNCGIFDHEYIIEANFYCDTYGLDTISTGTLIAFLMECYEMSIINKDITGGLELKFGNKEAAMELIHQMARGEGFGKIAGKGIHRLKEIFVREYGADPKILNDIGMEAKGMEYSEYVTKESLAMQGGYGLALKGPQHDEAWLIFMKANRMIYTEADFSSVIEQLYARHYVKALCLNVAHDCNLRCKYCFASKGDYHGKRELMSKEVGRNAVDFLMEHSGNIKNLEIDFFGGEPLMAVDTVKEVVSYARNIEEKTGKKFHFTITTNAMLLNDETINYLRQTMDNIVMSLDGRKEVNDRIRVRADGSGSYDMIVPNITKMVALREKDHKEYYVRGTFTNKNLDFAEDVFHMADLGFREISVEPVVDKKGDLLLADSDEQVIYHQYEKIAREYLRRRNSGKNPFRFYHFNVNIYHGPCIYKRLAACGAGREYQK